VLLRLCRHLSDAADLRDLRCCSKVRYNLALEGWAEWALPQGRFVWFRLAAAPPFTQYHLQRKRRTVEKPLHHYQDLSKRKKKLKPFAFTF
jgi:hypothetical protein